MSWYTIKNDHILIQIFAKPNARASQVVCIDERGLHITLKAKPTEGAANKELIRYLAELFKVPKNNIELVRGLHHRQKQILLPYSTLILQKLEALQIEF